jgi:hypothetical protein
LKIFRINWYDDIVLIESLSLYLTYLCLKDIFTKLENSVNTHILIKACASGKILNIFRIFKEKAFDNDDLCFKGKIMYNDFDVRTAEIYLQNYNNIYKGFIVWKYICSLMSEKDMINAIKLIHINNKGDSCYIKDLFSEKYGLNLHYYDLFVDMMIQKELEYIKIVKYYLLRKLNPIKML